MKTHQKFFVLCLLCAVVFVAVSACQKKSALDKDAPITLTLWHYYVGRNKISLDDAVAEFNKTVGFEKGIIVQAVGYGSIADLEADVLQSADGINGGKLMPDLFSSYADMAYKINETGKLADLTPYFSKDETDEYMGIFIKDGQFKGGKLQIIPVVKSTEILYVNDTEWEQFKAEKQWTDDAMLSTWESIYDASKQFYEWTAQCAPDKETGRAFMGVESVANYMIAACKQRGVDLFDANGDGTGRIVLDHSVLKKAFDLYYRGMALGYFSTVGRFCTDDIKTGNIIAFVGSTSSASHFPTAVIKDNQEQDISFLAMPYPSFKGAEPLAMRQGAGMCVTKGSEAEEEASTIFIKWFTDSKQNIKFSMSTGYIPVKRKSYQDPAFTSQLNAFEGSSETKAQEDIIVAGVYKRGLAQLLEGKTYAVTPFANSYDARAKIQETMQQIVSEDREIVRAKRAQHIPMQQIETSLDVEQRYQDWIKTLKAELSALQIGYIELN